MLRGPTSLNLNLESLASPEFLRLVAVLKPEMRRQTTIEIGAVDVLADTDRFAFLADYLHECGFRVALDGVDHQTLPHLMPAGLAADHLKLIWNPVLAKTDAAAVREPIGTWIERTPAIEVVLCHAATPAAIEVGRRLGIALYQGRHIDRCLNPGARPLN